MTYAEKPGKTFTVLDSLLSALEETATFASSDQVAPAAILWPDKERQWAPLAPKLRGMLPHFITLGDFASELRTGPSIWLKCMVARTLQEANWSADKVPILYLPGVSRQELRAVEECPPLLQPLAELQYRGVYWTQTNGKDWTVSAFLLSSRLEVAKDGATLEALLRALLRVMDSPVAHLRDKKLDAGFFNDLMNPDKVKLLLSWMNDPVAVKATLTVESWDAFRSSCTKDYRFDPEADGDLKAGEMLGARQDSWEQVWKRFAEAPKMYPNINRLLRRARPKKSGGLFFVRESWPQENETLETDLRKSLQELPADSPKDSSQIILDLEKSHAERRGWVWAELGEAPLADALRHLAALVEAAASPIGASSVQAMAENYAETGWKADAAVLHALGCVKAKADADAVKNAARILYVPWLEKTALLFQGRFSQEYPHGGYFRPPEGEDEPGTVILFADGLRMDVAHGLKESLLDQERDVEMGQVLSPIPTVTPTAKPAMSPVASLLSGDATGADFCPIVSESGKALTAERFRQILSARGYQILGPDDMGDPSGLGWTESGDLDHHGHQEGWKLALRVPECLRTLEERIGALLDHGWKKVRVVTDHGWLLLPGGLPKTDMPQYLVETRWGRCAVLKETSVVKENVYPWHWNPEVRLMLAPGISTFTAGMEYAHGGLTLQEVVVPTMAVQLKGGPMASANITSVEWVGFRCRVKVETLSTGLIVALRTKAGAPERRIAEDKALDGEGQTSLLVEDDSLEGTAVFLVVLDPSGRLVAQANTTVGG